MSLFVMTMAYHPDDKLLDDIGLTVSLDYDDVVIADNLRDAKVSLVDRNLLFFESIMDYSFVTDEESATSERCQFLDDIPTKLKYGRREHKDDWIREKWDHLSLKMKRRYAKSFFNHEPGEVFGLYTISQIPMVSIPDLRNKDQSSLLNHA